MNVKVTSGPMSPTNQVQVASQNYLGDFTCELDDGELEEEEEEIASMSSKHQRMGGTDDQLSPRSLFPNGGPKKSRMGKKERRGVFREKEGGHVSGNGPMRERSHHVLGGEGVRGPPSPLLR